MITFFKKTIDDFFPSYTTSSDNLVEVSLCKLNPILKTFAIVVSGSDNYSLVLLFNSYSEGYNFLIQNLLPLEYLNKDQLISLGFTE